MRIFFLLHPRELCGETVKRKETLEGTNKEEKK